MNYKKLLFIFLCLAAVGFTMKSFEVGECVILQNQPAFAGTSVRFTLSCTGTDAPLVAWDFGDGTGLGPFGPATTVTHTYTTPGTYFVFARIQGNDFPASMVQTIVERITNPRPTNSATIVMDTVNSVVWAVNSDNNSITSINAVTLAKVAEVGVGVHPRTVALDKNASAWVVNEDNATISVVSKVGVVTQTIALPYASRPYGICFDPQGANAFVTLSGTGKLLKINPLTGSISGEVSVGSTPRGIAVSSDGSRVFVTRFISPTDHGEITEVNPQNMSIRRVLSLAFDTTPDFDNAGRGVPNYITSIAISPNGRTLWVPSKKDNVARGMFRDGLALTFESTVRTIASQINLETNTEIINNRLDFNDSDMANAVAFSPFGNLAFVAMQGNNKIQVRNTNFNSQIGDIQNTGLAPQGLVFNKDGSKLFVQNFMSRTVRVFNTESIILGTNFNPTVLATVSTVTTEKLSPQVLQGKQIFYNAQDIRMTSASYISCASCHLDGGTDDRIWDFTDRGEGLRNTISLQGRNGMAMGNVHWTGNFDEIQDFENDIRLSFSGTGFMTDADFNATRDPLGAPKAGKSAELDALAAYIRSLDKVHPSPNRNANGTFTQAALAGKDLFVNLGCGTCHGGASFTDRPTGVLHDVGTIDASSGKRINQTLTGLATPTLKGVWETAPYLHNGSAATLRDVLVTKNAAGKHGNTASLSETQLTQLIAYLNQLDDESVPCTVQTITFATIPDKALTDPPFVLNATASSGLPVTYALVSGPATISGNTVTLTGAAGTVTITASQAGNATNCAASPVTRSFAVTAAGTGLLAEYYDNIDFSGTKVTRIDPTVNFNWGLNSPDPSLGVDTWSTRWTGQILAKYSETYTFFINSDNGRRLWINNVLVIDKWLDDWNIDYSGTIALTAGQKYDIKIEYFENNGDANIKFDWSSASQVRQVVPKSQLFPAIISNVPVTGVTISPTTANLLVGQTQQLTATVAPANATNKTVSWTSSNAAIATVNTSGLVTALAAGTATITVTTQDGNRTAMAQVAVAANPAGTGLSATYFDNMDLTGASITRIDPTVNFNWGAGSPDPALGIDTWSARWTGQILPKFSETYTFTINS
ncbi:MAG: PA14 domain-containing protein, partial [Bacteroidota bacterium]